MALRIIAEATKLSDADDRSAVRSSITFTGSVTLQQIEMLFLFPVGDAACKTKNLNTHNPALHLLV